MNEIKSACKKAAAALSQLKAKRVQPIPSGWFDINQYMEANDVSQESSRNSINELKKSNLLEEKNWPCLDAKGRIFHKRIYRNI